MVSQLGGTVKRLAVAVWVASALGLCACTSVPEPAGEKSPAPPTETVERSSMPVAPWSIIFADGSGNSFHFLQPSAEATAEYEYTPVTPEESSSGTYDGGMASRGELTAEQVQQIWSQVEAMGAATATHVDHRMKGTGAFVVTQHGTKREFVISSGPELDAFTALVTPWRTPQ